MRPSGNRCQKKKLGYRVVNENAARGVVETFHAIRAQQNCETSTARGGYCQKRSLQSYGKTGNMQLLLQN